MNTTVVKMARKSAAGVAKYSASRLTNCGNQLGSTIGSTMSSGTRNRQEDGLERLPGCLEVIRAHDLEADEGQHEQLHLEGEHREVAQ